MDDPDLLTIGRFARLTGLSIGALRHYDELDLLRPARTDPTTGYRLYAREQIEAARTIVRLRDLELPLETIREYLATDDPAEARRLLAEHRGRVEARTFRLQRVLHILGQLSTEAPTDMTATPDAPVTPGPTELDTTTRRQLAKDLFNHTWTLLEKAPRTAAEDDEMIHSAHASRYHWGEVGVGEPVNLARGEWQCSRVYAVLGRAEPALWHARRCLELNEAGGYADWDIASAYEATARAYLTAGDLAEMAAWKAKAIAALDGIADKDDRDLIEGDLATLP
ncbi:MAG: MerR family transcriptional regulator [Chloroflexota bacterium]